ncbi:MAG: class I adenylate cyclase, partial [Oceanidesulfovibrio sp.]
FAGNRFHTIRGAEPAFQEEEERARSAAVQRVLSDIALEQPAPALSSSEGLQYLHALVRQWIEEQDARKRLRVFRRVNRNRRFWTIAMLQGDTRDLLTLLPALVESPQVPGASLPPLACAISGHAPTRSALALLERYGLSQPALPDKTAQGTLRLEALFAIGSTGTIAQDRSSDLDLWVCYDKRALSDLQARALRAKLTAVEQWAWSTFGKEVHFFLMDLDAIHANDFGYSDQESSGSAQALLLKEEFYRTAMLLAGRPPAWWAAPPRLTREQYAEHLRLLRDSVSLRGVGFLDLGVMEPIPREEYFGAALWQIVKALKSPFKSILKIALLDKYSMGEAGQLLLCEAIKEALLSGRHDVWDVDSYAVMFREVFEHFQAQGNKEACDLLRLAFNKKTGLTLGAAASDRAFAMRGYSYMEYFFPYSEANIVHHLERRPGEADTEGQESFADLMQVGDRILRFVLNSYAAVQERLAEAGPTARVRPEDLTKMGRRIAARLAPGPNKILPLPFMRMRPGMLTGLEFSWQPTGNESVWSVRAEFPKSGSGKPAPEILRSEKSPEELAAWLVANEIYDPSVLLTAQSLEPPVSIPDMQHLLGAMRAFFPVPRIFDPPVGMALQEERAVRVFVTVNLTIPREVKRVSRIAVVWSTTWGQVFCKARLPATEKLRSDPYKELVKAMGMPVAAKPAVLFHMPHKAHCPAVRLLQTVGP